MLKPVTTNLKKIGNKIDSLSRKALQQSNNHYSCYLPENIGFMPSMAFKLLFSRVSFEPNQAEKLSEIKDDAIIIYANKYKSYFDYYFCHTRFRQSGIPFPSIGFEYSHYFLQPVSRLFRIFYSKIDSIFRNRRLPNPYRDDYFKESLLDGESAMLSIVGKKSFYRRFVKSEKDPLEHLIEFQNETDKDIYIVPQLTFFSVRPQRTKRSIIDILFGSEEKPGIIRRIVTIIKSPRKIFVELAEPISIREFLENPEISSVDKEQKSINLRRRILDNLNTHRQSITGPILKTRDELKETILTSDSLQDFMEKYSEETETPMNQVHKKADAYVEEIAANYSLNWIRTYEFVLDWLLKNLFEGMVIDQESLEMVKAKAKDAPMVLVPCHKSHLDYLIISYVFYKNNMPCPHIAAGKNLSFWPLGTIFRGGGAFFLRRTFKGKMLYSKVFSEYMKRLLVEGFNIEFFIEGGRSRTGKLLAPKVGLLTQLLDAYKEGACEDLNFVPIYIGYDRVLEEKSYMHEMEGGQKEPESVSGIIKARKFLKKRYGKVYVNFHDPVSLKSYLDENNIDIDNLDSKEKYKTSMRLGYKFINSINQASVVTPYGLVASALLNCSKSKISYDHLLSHIETYTRYLKTQSAVFADSIQDDQNHSINQAIEAFSQRSFIDIDIKNDSNDNSKAYYVVNKSKRPGLDYYKNNNVTFFVPAAFTSLAILENDSFQFSSTELHVTYSFLQDFFINEFSMDMERTPEEMILRNIKAFVSDGIIVPHESLDDTYNITSAGYRKLKQFSRFLKPYFEAYWVTLSFFMRPANDKVDPKNRLKKIMTLGNKMYKKKEIERPEALSKMTFKNGMNYFIDKDISGSEDSDNISFYAVPIQKYLNLMPS